MKSTLRNIVLFSVLMMGIMTDGCQRQNPYAPITGPKAPEVFIEYPRFDYQRVIGDNSIMDVQGYFYGVTKEWPPWNIDRLEVYVEGELYLVILPEELTIPPYEDLGHIRWPFRFEIKRFRKGPKRSVTVEIRSVRGNDTKSATIELLYNNERVRELAYERVLRVGCEPGMRFPRMASRRIYWTTEYQNAEKIEATRYALDFMAEHLGLEFIHTQDRSRRPIIIFLKNRCCSCCSYGGNYSSLSNDSGFLVAYVAADSGVKNIYGYASTVCHEVGHAIGLPHDRDAGSCMDYGGGENSDGLRLWPYQQYAIRRMYSVPTVYDCDVLLQ